MLRFRGSSTEFARAVFGAAAIGMFPMFTLAGPCDLSWDGDALARNVARDPALGMRLLDTNKNVIVQLSGAQIYRTCCNLVCNLEWFRSLFWRA